jgi:hypothetical protein
MKTTYKAMVWAALLCVTVVSAGTFNAQAEKDRKALIAYMEKKFADPEKNRAQFFPYSTDAELKKTYIKGIKRDDFRMGAYGHL